MEFFKNTRAVLLTHLLDSGDVKLPQGGLQVGVNLKIQEGLDS